MKVIFRKDPSIKGEMFQEQFLFSVYSLGYPGEVKSWLTLVAFRSLGPQPDANEFSPKMHTHNS